MKKLNHKGYALILVILIVAVVITLSSAMLLSLNTEIRLNLGTEEKEKANYLAQSGIEHGLALIEHEDTLPSLPVTDNWSLNGKTYRYAITNLSESQVSATGEILDGATTIQSVTINAEIKEGVVSLELP